MRTKEFLTKLEHDRIVEAIRAAESKTSGQIRVFIQRGELDVDPLGAAQKKFQRLGMHKTPERNAVLIFVAPRAHKFAVVGDKAIRGEYKGTGKTARERASRGRSLPGNLIFFLIFLGISFLLSRIKPRRGYHYSSGGGGWSWYMGGGGGSDSGGSSGGGGFSGFSGGGGSFGGGGAGSSW